jgi:hypothetical protein
VAKIEEVENTLIKFKQCHFQQANIQTLTTKNEVLELKVTVPEFTHSNRKNSQGENKPNPDPEVENDECM